MRAPNASVAAGGAAAEVPTAEGPTARPAERADFTEVARSCRAALQAGDYERAIALSEEGARVAPRHHRLADLGAWKAESLLRLGRAAAAEAELRQVEQRSGRTLASRWLASELHLLRGEHADCAAACDDAFILVPPSDGSSVWFGRLCRRKADALCRMGRRKAARRFLTTAFRDRAEWTSGDLSALRDTVRGPRDLQRLHDFLAPQFHAPDLRAPVALYHYALAARDLGRFDQAHAAMRQRVLKGAQIVRFGDKPRPPNPNWVAEARIALLQLKEEFDAVGARFFLVSGTFLGCVRDGDVIGHDKDIDVGVMRGANLARIARRLRASGRFQVLANGTKNLLRVKHANGVAIDVFVHWRERGRIYHEGRQRVRWWNTPFGLSTREFLGAQFLCPDNPDLYLKENYGRWEVPDPLFETFTDTPNMEVSDDRHVVWYYLSKMFDYYYAGKTPQLQKVGAALKQIRPDDVELWRAFDMMTRSAAPAAGEGG